MESNNIYSAALYADGIVITAYNIVALSLNEYKKMHFSRIARTKQSYRSILDVVMVSIGIDRTNMVMDKNGLKFTEPLFLRAKIAWGVGFKVVRERDLGNYTQKILQDALVEANFFIDDNHKIIHEDMVFFLDEKADQIKVFIEGDVNKHYSRFFVKDGLVSDEIARYKSRIIRVEQEDDGCEY